MNVLSVVTLVSSGFIFKDSFNISTLGDDWEISPSDTTRYSVNTDVAGSLLLKKGTEEITAFIKELGSKPNFVLSANIAYTPQVSGDSSGIVIRGDSSSALVLKQELPTSSVRPWIRVIKTGFIYQAYTSSDGKIWSGSLGTSTFNVLDPKIGLFLTSGNTSTANLNIKEVTITTGLDVTVANLTEGVTVKLLNGTGSVVQTKTCVAGSSEVKFDISQLGNPFVGNFSIKLPGSTPEYKPNSSVDLTIWQGDKYSFQVAPDLYYYDDNNVKVSLEEGRERLLGYHNVGSNTFKNIKMVARNNFTSGVLKNNTITTGDHKGTGQYTSQIKVANDVSGAPGTFTNTINLGDISPNTEKVFWLQVSKSTNPELVNDIYFSLGVSASFT